MSYSCDLVQNARKHKQFLKKLHELGVTVVGNDTNFDMHSLFRYQSLWLPLVDKHPTASLIPPPDIAWLWHCHRLSPASYIKYIEDTFGDEAVIEANPPFAVQIPSCPNKFDSIESITQHKWMILYPHEPFFLPDLKESSAGSESSDNVNDKVCDIFLSGFNLVASTERQTTFLWQISGERFEDDDFLEEGVENYTKFLKLKSKAREAQTILVPTYQIDLIWHTHILSSVRNYNKDCKTISGGILNHDDSLTDRSDGGILDVSFKGMVQLWKEEYNQAYVVRGGMYRGEPPVSFFSKDWSPSQQGLVAGANLHLVGQVGASSTPSATSLQNWATPIFGQTSENFPAFILAENARYKEDLYQLEGLADYVLGKAAHGTGWFHIETREAHEILRSRINHRILRVESDIACHQICCGSFIDREVRDREEAKHLALCEARKSLDTGLKDYRNRPHFATQELQQIYYLAGGTNGGVDCRPGSCGGSACAAKPGMRKFEQLIRDRKMAVHWLTDLYILLMDKEEEVTVEEAGVEEEEADVEEAGVEEAGVEDEEEDVDEATELAGTMLAFAVGTENRSYSLPVERVLRPCIRVCVYFRVKYDQGLNDLD